MKGFVVVIILMVVMAGIFHMLFIGFDYAFHNPDSGVFVKLGEAANKTMNQAARDKAENTSNMLRNAFGLARVICVGLIPVAAIIYATQKPRGG